MKGGMGLSPIEGVDWPWHFILIQPVTTELFSKFLRRGVIFCRFCTKTSSFFSFLRVTSGDTVCFLYIQKRPKPFFRMKPWGETRTQAGPAQPGWEKHRRQQVSWVLNTFRRGIETGDSLGGTDDVNFEFWIFNQAKKKHKKINCPKKDTRHVFFFAHKNRGAV